MDNRLTPGPSLQFPAHGTAKAAWDRMLQRAATDDAFRAQLRDNPVPTLRQAGIAVPDGVQVTFIDLDLKHAYLFLPPLQAAG